MSIDIKKCLKDEVLKYESVIPEINIFDIVNEVMTKKERKSKRLRDFIYFALGIIMAMMQIIFFIKYGIRYLFIIYIVSAFVIPWIILINIRKKECEY